MVSEAVIVICSYELKMFYEFKPRVWSLTYDCVDILHVSRLSQVQFVFNLERVIYLAFPHPRRCPWSRLLVI
jgi:hypothetical protein